MVVLKILGWVFTPYIMIFIYWKKLKVVAKTFGSVWALLVLLSTLGNILSGGSESPSSIPLAQEGTAQVNNAKVKDDKKAVLEAKKKKEAEAKAAKEKEIADKKAAELEEYNKPENVYERWVQSQFSAWDGSATALKKSVKENMKNPKSFEHVETTYTDKGDMLGIDVYMKFRGTNAFNAVVTQTVHASYDYNEQKITIESIE